MQKNLKNVSTLTTTISQIKKIKAGETVGYGRKARVKKDSMIAIVRIGYADGYPRRLGNGMGKMIIRNKMVSTIGNICMDMTMIDISGIKDVKEGDEVTVFGESLSLQSVAQWAESIPYEIMTGISQRVKRIYFEE
jgi:alanine racemase